MHADEAETHPYVRAVLMLLDKDIAKHPERLRGLPPDLYRRWMELTEGLDIDLDEPIEGPVAL